MPKQNICKMCSSENLKVFEHTATCQDCNVLLAYPYPEDERWELERRDSEDINKEMLKWHLDSGALNHHNFTEMVEFAMSDEDRGHEILALDYGGGGGQFALVLASLFPLARTYLVDLADAKLLKQYAPLNTQISFENYPTDETKFDVVFMNDVFEHVSDPLEVLTTIRRKLKKDGRVFIDTPRPFWIYPFTKIFSQKLHAKILRGTVDYDHQQIWSKKAFETLVRNAGYTIEKYSELSEFTQPADFYMKNMGISNPLLKALGHLFYKLAPYLAKNKIQAVIRSAG